MINIKKISFAIIISLLFLTKGNAAIKDSLFASVGDKAITYSDIVIEIKTILILNPQTFFEDKKDQLQSAAIQSIVKRNIKKIEIEKHDSLKFNLDDLDYELNRLASNINMDLNRFKDTFIANEIDFSTIVDQMQTELLWNSLIYKLYQDRISINLDEIEEQLKLIQNKKEIDEYLISEIIIKPISNDKLESEIKELKNKIKIEGFEKAALDLSISGTSIKGGNLGWISENIIPEKFVSKIITTPVGSISEPIFLPEGILIFKVRDKRKIKKFQDLNVAKQQLIKAEKTKVLKMYSLSHYENVKRFIAVNYY